MTDTTPNPRGPARYPNGQLGPGNPGKPRGARNRVQHRVAMRILTHFDAKGDDFLDKLSRWFAPDYLRLVGRLLPRGEGLGPELEALDRAETAAIVAAVRATLANIEAGEASLADLEAALAGPPAEAAQTVRYGENTVAGDVEGVAETSGPPAAPVGFVVS